MNPKLPEYEKYSRDFKGQTILVTGATGFVGTCLVRVLLNLGCDVGIVIKPTSDVWRVADILDNVRVFKTDVTNAEGLRTVFQSFQPCYVFHLAAYGAYGFQTNASEIVKTNVEGATNVLECVREFDCKRLVIIGSSSEYGVVDGLMNESDLPNPTNIYGATKVATSVLGQTYFRVYNCPVVILRPFSVYGPYEEPTRFIASVILAGLRGKSLELTKGEQKRDFIFMDDVILACLEAATNPRALGEVFNIGSGKEYTLRDVGEEIMKLMEYPVELQWSALPYREGEMWRWQANISKARKMLGWHPLFDIKAGLSCTIEWFRQNQLLFEDGDHVHASIRDHRFL